MSRPRSLADELEDGPLRREVFGAPPEPGAAPPEPSFRARLVFDGTGAEYFRIWVVNVLLTLLTLGLYSAWAKVRKARWFAQHTSLMGDRFDYHGRPWRILLGRVLALGLLVLWTWSFDLSLWLGVAVLGLMLAVGPLLFASAQRFRLASTSWRGLRFGFDAPRAEVYRVCVPLLLVWTLGSVAAAAGAPDAWVAATTAVLALLLPWAHARLKQLQHAHASFGGHGFAFERAGTAFYGLYAKAVALAIVGTTLASLATALVLRARQDAGVPAAAAAVDGADDPLHILLATSAVLLVAWLVAWPYFAARAQQIVWGRTRWAGQVGFEGRMRGSALWTLTAGQTALTLLSAGLYWPFAAVAIARYRIESVELVSGQPLQELTVTAPPAAGRATGDAAADLFGLDLGW